MGLLGCVHKWDAYDWAAYCRILPSRATAGSFHPNLMNTNGGWRSRKLANHATAVVYTSVTKSLIRYTERELKRPCKNLNICKSAEGIVAYRPCPLCPCTSLQQTAAPTERYRSRSYQVCNRQIRMETIARSFYNCRYNGTLKFN